MKIIGMDLASKPDSTVWSLGGIPITVSEYATREHWNFKKSRYRSRRLHKKLLKRFNGHQVTQVPAMFRIGEGSGVIFVAHPIVLQNLKRDADTFKNFLSAGPLA